MIAVGLTHDSILTIGIWLAMPASVAFEDTLLHSLVDKRKGLLVFFAGTGITVIVDLGSSIVDLVDLGSSIVDLVDLGNTIDVNIVAMDVVGTIIGISIGTLIDTTIGSTTMTGFVLFLSGFFVARHLTFLNLIIRIVTICPFKGFNLPLKKRQFRLQKQ